MRSEQWRTGVLLPQNAGKAPSEGVSNAPDKHIKLVLRALPSGQCSAIHVKKSTADFLGWTLHFQTYADWVADQIAMGVPMVRQYRAHEPRKIAGTPLRIGRGKNKRLNEAGLTNSFRINSKVSIADLAELASFTEVDWHWMERPNGSRMDRQWWWDKYQSSP